MYHIFCINSSVEGHLGSFQVLAIINKAAKNIVEHVSFLPVGTFSGYMPRRGIAGSSGSTISSFLKNCQTDFQSGCTSLQSHQQWRSVPLSPHPHQHLLKFLNRTAMACAIRSRIDKWDLIKLQSSVRQKTLSIRQKGHQQIGNESLPILNQMGD